MKRFFSLFHGLRGNVLGGIVLVFLVITVLAMTALWQFSRTMLGTVGTQTAVDKVRLRQAQIDGILGREIALTRTLATSPALRAWADTDDDPLLRVQAFAELDRVGRLFRSGKPVFSSNRTLRYYTNDPLAGHTAVRFTRAISDHPDFKWYAPLLAHYAASPPPKDDVMVSVNLQRTQAGLRVSILRVWVSVPVRKGNEILGFVGTGFEFEPFAQTVLPWAAESRTLLVNHDGAIFADSQRLGPQTANPQQDDPRIFSPGYPAPGQLSALLPDPDMRAAFQRSLTNTAPGALETLTLTHGSDFKAVALARLESLDMVVVSVVNPKLRVLKQAWHITAVLLGLLLLVSLLFMLLMQRMVIKPLRLLVRGANQVAAGNYGVQLPARADDELGELTRAFNTMSAKVRNAAEHLEHTVEERTRNLAAALANETLALQQQSQFIAMVSHEFRNPLAIIKSQAQVAQREADSDPASAAARHAVVERAANRLEDLFTHWLEGDRLHNSAFSLHSQRIELADWLADCTAHAWREREHRLHRVAVDTSLVLEADPGLLSLALGNLLDNACKYSPVGSEIVVSLVEAPDALGIAVQDQGIGIGEDDLPRVFDKYFRAQHDRSIRGLGLGLFLVQRIMDLHGGRVSVTSQLGRGSVFTLWLPRPPSDQTAGLR